MATEDQKLEAARKRMRASIEVTRLALLDALKAAVAIAILSGVHPEDAADAGMEAGAFARRCDEDRKLLIPYTKAGAGEKGDGLDAAAGRSAVDSEERT